MIGGYMWYQLLTYDERLCSLKYLQSRQEYNLSESEVCILYDMLISSNANAKKSLERKMQTLLGELKCSYSGSTEAYLDRVNKMMRYFRKFSRECTLSTEIYKLAKALLQEGHRL